MNLRILKSGLFVVAVLALLGACSSDEVPGRSGESPDENPRPVQENLTAPDRPEQSEDVAAEAAANNPPQAEAESDPNAEPAPVESVTSAVAGRLPDGPGREEFEQICSQCHGVDTVISLRRSEADWHRVIEEMLGMGADATNYQASLILNYLTQNFGL